MKFLNIWKLITYSQQLSIGSLLENLTEALDSNEDVGIIYLDFAKAFDKVPHKHLLKKTLGVWYPRKGSQLDKRILDRQVAKSRNRR